MKLTLPRKENDMSPTPELLLAQAKDQLLSPTGLDYLDLARTLDSVLANNSDFADIFIQSSRTESWSLEGGIVRVGNYSLDRGFGLRSITHDETAFAFSQIIDKNSLKEAGESLRSIARQGQQARAIITPRSAQPFAPRYANQDPILSRLSGEKIRLLERIDREARSIDSLVVEVSAGINCSHETVLIMRHDGQYAADVRPMLRLFVTIILQRGEQYEMANGGLGGRLSLEDLDHENISAMLKATVNEARIKLDASPAPSGEMTVVIGPGWPGMLLHEAVGHGLEGDFTRQGSSIYSNRIGQKVAGAGVSIVDNGSLPNLCGSLSIDDEGEPSRETILIENGILRGYMQDSLTAKLTGAAKTGNGRRQSYAHLPMPRMTNTYMLNGETPPEEIIASVRSGIYLQNLGNGQVDIVSGRFNFESAMAYRIENGRLTTPIKGATLTGSGPQTLLDISMVGNDLALDPGIAACGKSGQNIPVCVGQPTLKVDRLLVGGTT